jgi:hypothetical protein
MKVITPMIIHNAGYDLFNFILLYTKNKINARSRVNPTGLTEIEAPKNKPLIKIFRMPFLIKKIRAVRTNTPYNNSVRFETRNPKLFK